MNSSAREASEVVNKLERKAYVGIACSIAVVFSFLGGYLVSNADWFRPAKASLLRFLHNEEAADSSEGESSASQLEQKGSTRPIPNIQ